MNMNPEYPKYTSLWWAFSDEQEAINYRLDYGSNGIRDMLANDLLQKDLDLAVVKKILQRHINNIHSDYYNESLQLKQEVSNQKENK